MQQKDKIIGYAVLAVAVGLASLNYSKPVPEKAQAESSKLVCINHACMTVPASADWYIPPGDEILHPDGDAIHQYCWHRNVSFEGLTGNKPGFHDYDAEKARIAKCEALRRGNDE